MTEESYVAELRARADACEAARPERAVWYRQEALKIERDPSHAEITRHVDAVVERVNRGGRDGRE